MKPGGTARVVLVTAPDLEVARRLAHALVEQRLAACVNLDWVRSIYRWEGVVEEQAEALMVIKTTAARLEELEAWIAREHPYDTPECVALEPAAVEGRYLAWLERSCAEEGAGAGR